MNAPDHFDFYTLVLFLHITSAVIAFGATFAFPIIDVTIRRVDLRALPVWNEAQNQIGYKLITPGATLVLISGIYMAIDRWSHFGTVWFSIAGVIVIVLLGLGHGFFAPTARKLRDQAKADLAAGAAERGTMSAEYEALAARVRAVGILSSLLVVAALLLMVWKPGA
ncbi:MAG TPA: DUF2269 family protein [Conexibacter sp.]|jgi:hypothetical protein|nr:DUF2269 family protein [Conexibacter sp.]